MLNIELCRRLKAAGFPQETAIELPNSLGDGSMLGGFYWGFPKLGGCGGLAFYRKEELETEMNREKTEPNHQWEFMKCPTFEELVKECMRFGLEFGEGMPSFTMRLEGGKIEKSAGWRAVETYAEG